MTQNITKKLSNSKKVVGCPVCHQKKAIPNEGLECLSCGTKIDNPEKAANAYLTDYLGKSEYRIVKEGGEWPLYECPNCDAETLVIDEDGNFICFSCGETYDSSDLSRCIECGQTMLKNEMDLCENCLDYKINRD